MGTADFYQARVIVNFIMDQATNADKYIPVWTAIIRWPDFETA